MKGRRLEYLPDGYNPNVYIPKVATAATPTRDDGSLAAALREKSSPADPFHELRELDAGDARRLRQQTV